VFSFDLDWWKQERILERSLQLPPFLSPPFMAIVKSRKVALAPLLSVSIPLAASLAWQPLVHSVKFPQIYASLAFSVVAFVVTLVLIPRFGSAFVNAGLKGRDLLKKSLDDVSVENALATNNN
jgi:hypothetical protein